MPPLLCVLHGDECEHADIRRHLLHFLGERDNSFASVHEYSLQLEPCRDAEELRDFLEERLSSYDFADFEAKLRNGRQALVIHGTLYAGDWFAANERHWLHTFAEFWSTYQANIPWLLLVCVKYSEPGAPGGWLGNLLSRLRRSDQATDVTACLNELESLGMEDFKTRFTCPGVVLPCLSAISYEDAARWTDHHRNDLQRYGADIELLSEKIRGLYQDQAQLPMCKLGRHLKNALMSESAVLKESGPRPGR